MMRDSASVRKVCLGLSVAMLQLLFIPTAVAKKKKHKGAQAAATAEPASPAGSPATPVAGAPAKAGVPTATAMV